MYGLTMLFLFYQGDGTLKRVNLAQLCGNEASSSSSSPTTKLNCAIISLFTAQNLRTREWFIVGGGDDGSVLIWQTAYVFPQVLLSRHPVNRFETHRSLKLVARWTIFISPLVQVLQCRETTGPLRGCVLCASRNGTVAVIALDGLQLSVVTSSPSPCTPY